MPTLRMLTLVAGGLPGEWLFLAWDGAPPDAHRTGRDAIEGDLDLGGVAEFLPNPPDAPGLWLLVWEWERVPAPGAGDPGADLVTLYATAAPTWLRPAAADLVALGLLPTASLDPSTVREATEAVLYPERVEWPVAEADVSVGVAATRQRAIRESAVWRRLGRRTVVANHEIIVGGLSIEVWSVVASAEAAADVPGATTAAEA